MEAVNRKLIRPSLNEIKEQIPPPRRAPAPQQKKPVPPDQTNAENFYYVKQMQAKTPMVFVLRDGETLHGVIEWYDKCCLKVNRTEGPNILLYKPSIKYMYKEARRRAGRSGPQPVTQGETVLAAFPCLLVAPLFLIGLRNHRRNFARLCHFHRAPRT